ncbi:MAG: ORF6N domain-containing protein [Acidobacteria bacterium]|nr:ORF6N domain-containing protein [Acidobacteriota bacterium]
MAKTSPTKIELAIVTLDHLERRIYEIRGYKVMLDSELAELYGVTTKRLNEQVRRNLERFPDDFSFQLTGEEHETLRSQFATSKIGRGGRRYMPYVFTEQGVAMLSSVLNSQRAVQVNIAIMRAFVNMRKLVATNADINKKLTAIEKKLGEHDGHFKQVFGAIRAMMKTENNARPIGYIRSKKKLRK